ncbi:MAG: hypothetical protein L0Z62_18460 [Gemmataceae bacterium]|nr:hypothetical protein [Gemmataceae bacterium]
MRLLVSLLMLVAFTTVGCGPRSGTLTGKISLEQAPLKVGTIAVYSEDGQRSAMGTVTSDDGTYLVEKAPAGPVKIAVIVPSPKELIGIPNPDMPPEERAKLVEYARKVVPIPLIYADPEKSNLRTTVEANAQNTYDIELKK